MAKEKMKKQIVTSPIGTCKWFSVNKVDKFGNYTVELHLEDEPRAHKFIQFIKDFHEGKMPFEEKPEGGFKLKLKSKSKGTTRDNKSYVINPPAIYNAVGQRLQGAELEALNIGNGSEIRAKVEVKAYNFMGVDGVSLGLKSVQIIKAIAFEGDLGFDAIEPEHVNEESEEQEQSMDEGQYDF